MFGQNLEVQLSSARTEDTTVVWKSFHDSITLIVLSSEEGTSELRLERLLQMVFGAMVLLVGLEELTNIRNVERLKKELRASYRLIDSFLGDSELIGDLTQCVDCVVPPEGSLLQEALSGFAEAAGTAFGSLVVSGRVVAATESWWRLGTPEAVLLPWLVGSLPPQAARDYPVYLPHGSPTVPHRLLTLTLLPGLELCLLCGPRPPLSQLDPQAAASPPGTETLPLHGGALCGSRAGVTRGEGGGCGPEEPGAESLLPGVRARGARHGMAAGGSAVGAAAAATAVRPESHTRAAGLGHPHTACPHPTPLTPGREPVTQTQLLASLCLFAHNNTQPLDGGGRRGYDGVGWEGRRRPLPWPLSPLCLGGKREGGGSPLPPRM
ncbi:protein fuzzy homolog isoform X6 [Mirounga leonina]|nr:protein fuzzy homolog isoform X6 [Mirounga leonina]